MIYQIGSIVLVAFFALSSASRLVDERVNFYERILREVYGKDKLDVDGLVQLLQLTQGHPKYNHAAVEYIVDKWGGAKEISFEYLHKLVNLIYGDQISDDPFQPQELHLAYTNDPSSMKIMWVTMQGLEKPFVQYMSAVSSKWELAKTKVAATSTYTVPEKWWPVFNGVIYDVDMTDLSPDSHYKYRVGGFDNVNQTMRYSEEFTFKAAPLPSPDRTTRVFTGADHGTFELLGFETVLKMTKMMDELRPDFTFIAGDLSYAGLDSEVKALDISKDDEFEMIWDLLGIQNQPVSARIPWMVGVGNHESFYNFTAFNARYKMPQTTALNTNQNFWYTFTYGNIQWVSISSEHDLSEGSPQNVFIRQALTQAQNNRANVPWIILTIHKPIYCSVEGSPSFASRVESLLLEFDVDLAITGHMHAYERIHPVNGGAVSVYPVKQKMNTLLKEVDVYYSKGKGPVHVMQGHAGGFQAERWTQPPPAWSAYRMADGILPRNSSDNGLRKWFHEHGLGELDLSDETSFTELQLRDLPLVPSIDDLKSSYNYSHTFGFGYITALNATHLHYQAIPNVDMPSLRNHDEFWIVKEH